MSDGTLSFAAVIDTSGYEKGIERMSNATNAVGNMLKNINVTSLTDKFGELDKICQGYDSTIASLKTQMQGYIVEAEKAVSSGDTVAFASANKEIDKLRASIEETTQEAQPYRDALAMVADQLGIIANTPKPPMFFTQEELAIVEALQDEITGLREKLAGMQTDDANYSKLQARLTDATERLNDMEASAAKAASKLGTDLGERAAEASERLYILNRSVSEQEKKVKGLEDAVDQAAVSLKNLSATSDDTEAIARAKSAYDAYVESLHNAQLQLEAMRGAQADASNSFTRINTEVKAHDSIMVKMLGGQEKYTQIISNLPSPLQSVIGGMNGMTGAAKMFIATPLGAIISAIVLGLQALYTWFNSSKEGQLAFAKASGYVSGILGQLKEIVIAVGKAIYNAFNDPKKAVSDFVDFLKSQVMNRVRALGDTFSALGDIISHVFKGEFDEAKQSVKELGESYAEFLTGVEDVTDKVAAWADSTNKAAEATARISLETKQLEIATSEWQAKKTRLETQMTELYTQMMDNSLSKEKRKQLQKEYEALVQTVSDEEIRLATKARDLQKEKNDLTSSTIEDVAALDELENRLAQAEAYKANRMRMMQRMDNRLNKVENNPQNRIDKLDEHAALQMERLIKDVEFSATQAKIDAMQDGEEKILAQMALNHERELEEMKREKEDYLQKKIDTERAKFTANPKNKGKRFDSSTVTLSDEETLQFNEKEANIRKKHQNENEEYSRTLQQAMNEYLKQWGIYEEKREAITALAQEKLSKAMTEGERLSITAQLNKDLSDLDMEANKKTNAIAKLFGDMSEKTVKDLRSIASDGQKALDMLVSGNYDKELGKQLNISEATFNTLKASPAELDKIRKAIKQLSEQADGLETPLNKISKGLKDLFNAADNPQKFDKALAALKSGLDDVMRGVSVLSDAFTSLGDAFGSDLMSGIGEGLNTAMDAMNGAMQGAQAGAVFGPWGAAAGAAIGLVGSLGSSLAKLHDAKHEKKIQQLQEQAEVLEKSYGKLGKEIEKAYSKDASNLIEQQNKLLQQQKVLIQQQIREEESKKKTDNDRIKQWKEQIEEINDTIEANKDKAIDAIFGEDVKSAIDRFADAYASMFDDGISKAKASKDLVKDMIKNMIVEAMKSDISKPMEALRDKMREFWNNDGSISTYEEDILNGMAEKLMSDLEGQYGWADKYFKGSFSQGQGSSGGFQAMSEDTAEELNGRFTSMVVGIDNLDSTLQSVMPSVQRIEADNAQLVDYAQEMQNISLLQLSELEAISAHCKAIYEMSEELLTKIERNTSDL